MCTQNVCALDGRVVFDSQCSSMEKLHEHLLSSLHLLFSLCCTVRESRLFRWSSVQSISWNGRGGSSNIVVARPATAHICETKLISFSYSNEPLHNILIKDRRFSITTDAIFELNIVRHMCVRFTLRYVRLLLLMDKKKIAIFSEWIWWKSKTGRFVSFCELKRCVFATFDIGSNNSQCMKKGEGEKCCKNTQSSCREGLESVRNWIGRKEISFTSSKFINVDMEDMGHSSLHSSQPFIDFFWLLWMQRAIPAC